MKKNIILYSAIVLLVIEFFAPYFVVDTIGALYYYQHGDSVYGIVARDISWILYIFAGLTILLAGLFLWYFIKNKRKSGPVEVVEFSAPDDLSSAEVGCIIDGVINDKDVSSLLVYWASKGYIKIEEVKGKKEDVKITKINELPDYAKTYEKNIFRRLFVVQNVIMLSDVANAIGEESVKASKIIDDECQIKYFNSKKQKSRQYWFISFVVLYVIYGLFDAGIYRKVYLPDVMLISGVVMLVLGGLYYMTIQQRYSRNKNLLLTLRVLIISIFIAGSGVSIYFSCGLLKAIWIPIIILILALVSLISMNFIEVHTPKGKEILGRLIGLRNFINIAEKDRINQLVEEDPEYFFHILPYAYVLGVSDKWIKEFEVMKTDLPSQRNNTEMVIVAKMIDNTIWRSMISYRSQKAFSNISRTSRSSGGGGSRPRGGSSTFGGRGRKR